MFESIHSLAQAFSDGGIWMWAILACQVISIIIVIERTMALYLARRPNQLNMIQPLEKAIKSGDLEDVIETSKEIRRSNPIGQVALVGAIAAKNFGGKEEIQLKMDEVLIETSQKLDRNTAFLSTIANISTLLGLLGTIVGMITAFSSLTNAQGAERQNLLALGISMAMYTTAYGLIVAIPTLAAYAVLQNRSQQLMDDLNKAAMKLYIWMTYSFESVPASSAPTATVSRAKTKKVSE